jgi:hypothetical protein
MSAVTLSETSIESIQVDTTVKAITDLAPLLRA